MKITCLCVTGPPSRLRGGQHERWHCDRRILHLDHLNRQNPANVSVIGSTYALSAFAAFTDLLLLSIGDRSGGRVATKRSVGGPKEADLKGKRMFVRAGLNVPSDDNQTIIDDARIRAAVQTIKYLIEHGARIILTSHLVDGVLVSFTAE
ncbi:phosphoglycerate kinase [Musa troglodytarum]|uniref:Phosphoglycerate kinase n=1 Tax=Musa troglodytarum TaxID=320322 RepID=A0A9E7F505_9LILI|nr:phosphoglycerate kinase [Musa troglodytarum]